ncbi:hypothetical protein NOCARDAX2BIS_190029 [Nocardioides sp. AX2bis]|nr:hypothetical protein NOCARDAX2BIS_190029 [Nocardioides sp. AX2bis]
MRSRSRRLRSQHLFEHRLGATLGVVSTHAGTLRALAGDTPDELTFTRQSPQPHRGTSTDEMEPEADGLENPWDDLWFYSNPVFVNVR